MRTKVICSHHNAVLVFDCENTGPRNDGLSAQTWVKSRNRREMWLDGLSALDSFGKSVLDIVGPLMNRIGSVGIEGIVSLQVLQ